MHIIDLENHSLFPKQFCLNDVHVSEVPKLLAWSFCKTTHAIMLMDSFNTALPLIILLQFSRINNYYNIYLPSIAKYENENLPKIHFTSEEHPWDPSTHEHSERKTFMLYHWGPISIIATAAREPVSVKAAITYSLAMNNDDFVTALSTQIQLCKVLIGMVRKSSPFLITAFLKCGITLLSPFLRKFLHDGILLLKRQEYNPFWCVLENLFG